MEFLDINDMILLKDGSRVCLQKCVICRSRRANVRFLPCKHMIHGRCHYPWPITECLFCKVSISAVEACSIEPFYEGGEKFSSPQTANSNSIQRSGRWSSEETAYARLLMEGFSGGMLPVGDKTNLGGFLCQMLLCNSARLSSKLRTGKRVFAPKKPSAVLGGEISEYLNLQKKISDAEDLFLTLVARSGDVDEAAALSHNIQYQWMRQFVQHAWVAKQPLNSPPNSQLGDMNYCFDSGLLTSLDMDSELAAEPRHAAHKTAAPTDALDSTADNHAEYLQPSDLRPTVTSEFKNTDAPSNNVMLGSLMDKPNMNALPVSDGVNECFREMFAFCRVVGANAVGGSVQATLRLGMRAVREILGLFPNVCSLAASRRSQEVFYASSALVSELCLRIANLTDIGAAFEGSDAIVNAMSDSRRLAVESRLLTPTVLPIRPTAYSLNDSPSMEQVDLDINRQSFASVSGASEGNGDDPNHSRKRKRPESLSGAGIDDSDEHRSVTHRAHSTNSVHSQPSLPPGIFAAPDTWVNQDSLIDNVSCKNTAESDFGGNAYLVESLEDLLNGCSSRANLNSTQSVIFLDVSRSSDTYSNSLEEIPGSNIDLHESGLVVSTKESNHGFPEGRLDQSHDDQDYAQSSSAMAGNRGDTDSSVIVISSTDDSYDLDSVSDPGLALGAEVSDPLTRSSFSQILGQFLLQVPFHLADVWVPVTLPPNTTVLVLGGSAYLDDRLLKWGSYSQNFYFKPSVGIPGRVLSHSIPEAQRDVTELSKQSFLRVEGARSFGLRASLAVPVKSGDGGAMVVIFYSRNTFSPSPELIQFTEHLLSRWNFKANITLLSD